MQTGRLPVLIGNIAKGPNPVFRQNVLKALVAQAFDSDHRVQCELNDCLRETFGLCDRSSDTGQRAHWRSRPAGRAAGRSKRDGPLCRPGPAMLPGSRFCRDLQLAMLHRDIVEYRLPDAFWHRRGRPHPRFT